MRSLDLQPEQAFGHYAPRGITAMILAACHAIPAHWPAARSLNKLLRGLIKRPARQFDVEAGGLKLRLRSAGNYCERRQLFEPQFFDAVEIDWLCDVLAEGGVFLDVGGNIGLYSLHVARRCPDARVVTVEPDSSLAERMRFNAAQNAIRVELAGQALSDYTGTGKLWVGGPQSGVNQLDRDDSDGIEVAVTTLLDLCESHGLSAIRAMKIDIEGHEDRVLSHFFAHAPRDLWPDRIVIEHIHDDQHIVTRLQREFGYRVEGSTRRNMLLAAPQA